MSEKVRPNPDELLKGIHKNESRIRRGNLRVFFGMCPGVGKTYAMLKTAQELLKSGISIAVGIVETHQRAETQALLSGLKIIPRKKIEYKGTVVEEMDIDQILKERPDLVLVDELAHTNAPEHRHPKRYQDVEELLNAGINVFTTLNVQHIESRADLVQQITGATVRETVPDSILELANQIELVDVSPQELLKRLKEGKVYLGERAEKAAQNFFKEEHLTALRELALRFTAEKVDDELKDYMAMKQILGPWNTKESLLVAVSHSPYSQKMIRATRRLAFNLGAPWIALYVDRGDKLDRNDHEMLIKNLALAKELGGEVLTTQDSNVSQAVKRVAREKNVTQIIMGRPDRRFWSDLFSGGTLVDQLVREAGPINVHVLGKEDSKNISGVKTQNPFFYRPLIESGFFSYWFTLWGMVAVSLISYGLLPFIGYKAIGFIFLMAVIVVSIVSTIGPTLFAAAFSALTWNYFYIPPQFDFEISSSEDIMMCIIYFVITCASGFLTTKIRKQRKDLLQREFRANALYELMRDISETKGQKEIGEIVGRCIEKVFDAGTSILIMNSSGKLEVLPRSYYSPTPDEKDIGMATWSFSNRKKAGWSTDTLSNSRWMSIPLHGRSGSIGVILFAPTSSKKLSIEQENMLDNIAHHLAIALEREQFEQKANTARLLEESEKLHQALLNSVSHELRTPLTTIVGTATALQDPATFKNDQTRSILLQDLIDSVERLNRVVENLLDMTRLEGGILSLKKEFFEVNEFIQSSIQHLKRPLSENKIILNRIKNDVFVEGDCRLLEHAFSNILVNAAHYSPKGSSIEVSIEESGPNVLIKVSDEGRGIPEGSLDKIFQKFYRVPGTPTGGMGLGLSIVKSIIETHGGTITANHRADRSGSVISILLPRIELPLEIRREEAQ